MPTCWSLTRLALSFLGTATAFLATCGLAGARRLAQWRRLPHAFAMLILAVSLGWHAWLWVRPTASSSSSSASAADRDGGSVVGDACLHRFAVLARLNESSAATGDDAPVLLHRACYAHQLAAAYACRAQQRGGAPWSAAPPWGLPAPVRQVVRTRFRDAELPSFSLYDMFAPPSSSSSSSTAPLSGADVARALHTARAELLLKARPGRAAGAVLHVIEVAAAALFAAAAGAPGEGEGEGAYAEWVVPSVEEAAAARARGSPWREGHGWWGVCDALGHVALWPRDEVGQDGYEVDEEDDDVDD